MNYYLQTIKDLFIKLIGLYEPYTVTDPDTGTVTVIEGLAGIDWPWIAGAALTLIAMYWLGRLFVNLITGRR